MQTYSAAMALICLWFPANYPKDLFPDAEVVIVGEAEGKVREEPREILRHLLLVVEGKEAVTIPVAIGIAPDSERAVRLRFRVVENVRLSNSFSVKVKLGDVIG